MKVTFNPNDGKKLIFKNADVLFLSYTKVIMTISGVRTELSIGKNVEVLIEEDCNKDDDDDLGLIEEESLKEGKKYV